MRVYPVNLLLEDKRCLVVGGGKVAFRKVGGLLDAGAKVTVVSPEVCDTVRDMIEGGFIDWIQCEWSAELIDGAALVVAATDNEEINRTVANDAKNAKIPVNVADDPDHSDFVLPSVMRKGPLTIAVGTGGNSPALAAHLRLKLEDVIGKEYQLAAEILGELRKILLEKGVDPKMRAEIFKNIVRSGLAEKLANADRAGAMELIKQVAGKFINVENFTGEHN